MALQIQTAADGVVRDAHYVIPTGASEPVRTLLTEPQRTNLMIRSQEFGTWSDVLTCPVTDNAAIAPDGTATADLLTATATGSARSRGPTFTADGVKCASIFLKQGTSTQSRVALRDLTALTDRHNVNVVWSAGVPTLSTAAGAGILFQPQEYGNGWWRILFSADGIVAANSNAMRVIPDPIAGTGTVLVWGAQAENAVVPSSYIPTEAAAVVRNADSLYWELASLVPQEMTVYQRFVNLGVMSGEVGTNRWAGVIGNAANTGVRLLFGGSAGAPNRARAIYNDGTTSAGIDPPLPSPVAVVGDIIELRVVLSPTWTVTAGISINGASELTATSTASGPAAAFAEARYWLAGATFQDRPNAITNTGIFRGTRDRAYCRANTGVV
jgi:hypothetical protein